MSELRGEDLLAELKRKESDLLLAAQLGKNLLEEKESLQQDVCDLRADLKCLEEVLEAHKQESSKSKKFAEEHISEVEEELERCRSSLELERAARSSAREEFRRSCRVLEEENSQLKEQIAQVTEKHAVELQELNTRLIESRGQNTTVTVKCTQCHSLKELEGQNQKLSQDLSSLSRSCERLSLELEDSRDVAVFWENQYHSQEELLHSQARELGDSRYQLKILQTQLQQSSGEVTASRESLSSGMSLYDELSQFEGDNDSCALIEDEKTLTLQPIETESPISPISELETMQDQQDSGDKLLEEESVQEGGLECQRCQDFQLENKQLKAELKSINEQLLIAVQQKFKLQQQVEEWQCDMACVMDSKLQHKLAKDQRQHRCKSKREQDKSGEGCCCLEDSERNRGQEAEKGRGRKNKNTKSKLALHILKDSWLF